MSRNEREHGVYELVDETGRIMGFANCACSASRMVREVRRDFPERDLVLSVEGCRGTRFIRRYPAVP